MEGSAVKKKMGSKPKQASFCHLSSFKMAEKSSCALFPVLGEAERLYMEAAVEVAGRVALTPAAASSARFKSLSMRAVANPPV